MAKRKSINVNREQFFTEAELAKLLKCSKSRLQKERYAGRGCPFIKDGRRVLYPKSDVQEYINANRVVHPASAAS